MAMTVAELVRIDSLRSRVVAGACAGHRVIEWAHSCEMPDPWAWLGRGDLVMTTGLGLPDRPEEQVRYVERCARSGLVGVAIGEDMSAPPLSAATIAAADRLGFAVILTARDVPFVAMARAVATAKQSEEQARIEQTKAVYETVLGAMTRKHNGAALLREVGDSVGCDLLLVDVRDRRPLLLDDTPPGRSASAEPGRSASSGTTRSLAVPGFPNAALIVQSRSARPLPDPSILQHVSLLGALELERRNSERERDRRRGAYLLAHLIDGQTVPGDIDQLVSERGLGGGAMVLVALAGLQTSAEVHHVLADRGVPNAMLPRRDRVFVLVPDDEDVVSVLAQTTRALGVSDPFTDARTARTAVSQADLALATALDQGEPVVRFNDRAVSLLPRSVEEADELVRRVLSALIEHDERQRTEYLRSLQVFLEENRSWQRAAARLQVHKQTLVYRMQRISQLTGRRLDNTADVAALWIALRTAEALRH